MINNYRDKIASAQNLSALEELRIEIFGKKGVLTAAFTKLKEVSGEEKALLAKTLNETKEVLTQVLENKKGALEEAEMMQKLLAEKIDPSLFTAKPLSGALHPIRETMDKMTAFFLSMNFSLETGPIIENDFNNFEALNLPAHHPARDMQDTFYLNSGMLLRTHTSSVQTRVMTTRKPPIRMIAPGAVCRRDFDVTHTPMFHQVEGLVVDEEGKVSFANLKYMLTEFLHHMFGDVKVRFRPSFFPFTEPSSEVDISCVFCGGEGCRICKHTGWLEVLGCGTVDPNVFKAVGYEGVSGYAFGMGVERFVMLIHRVNDMRLLYEGDLRLLEQFQ